MDTNEVDPPDPAAYTTCFAAAYGKSLMHSGSFRPDPPEPAPPATRRRVAILPLRE